MKPSIHLVTLAVEDLERSLAFYRVLAATLSAHEPATLNDHGSASL